jgi:hypothetical protein
MVPEELYKTGKNGHNGQIGQKRTKTHKNLSMHKKAGFGINQNPVITLKNFCG